jgi:signal transduction histidine kinase
LIGNAVKFTFSGGVTIKVKYANGILITSVEDTGVGMKPTDMQKLFRFFGKIKDTKKINQGGMGLGLTISKMILD